MSDADNLAKYDVTRKICQYLDPHLVIYLLNRLKMQNIFDTQDVCNEILRIVKQTRMWDLAVQTWSESHPGEAPPEEFRQGREEAVKLLQQQEKAVEEIVSVFSDEETVEKLKTVNNSDELNVWLRTQRNVTDEMFFAISNLAKTKFDCGDYTGAAEYLDLFLQIWPKFDPRALAARWGKLCCEIHTSNWEDARADVDVLKELIGKSGGSLRETTEQKEDTLARAWLIHWHLFVDFGSSESDAVAAADGSELPEQSSKFIEIVCDPQDPAYWQTFRNYCPHLYRYLIAAAILNKNANTNQWMTQLVENTRLSFTQEAEGNMDPLLDFAISLYREYNFERAKRALSLSEQVLQVDPFLHSKADKIFDSARTLMYEFVCGAGVFARLSIPQIARETNKAQDETEKWIVDIIKQASLEAKIDSEKGEIKLEPKIISPYAQLKNKTKMVNIEMQRLRAALVNRRY